MWKDISNSKQSESQFYPSAESLAASHEACRQMGVRKDQRRIAECVDGSNARPRPFSDHAYIDKAKGLLAEVHAMLPDRGSVLILTDNSSRVLVLCAIPEVIDRCKGIGLQVGRRSIAAPVRIILDYDVVVRHSFGTCAAAASLRCAKTARMLSPALRNTCRAIHSPSLR